MFLGRVGPLAVFVSLVAVARRHKLFVIEDCAQAVGAHYRGTPVGAIGDVGTFSFYPTKNLGGCGEGGALVSRREELHTQARHIQQPLGPQIQPLAAGREDFHVRRGLQELVISGA